MQFISEAGGFLAQNELVITLILVFASITLLVIAGAWMLTGRSVVRKRLEPGSTGVRHSGSAPPLSIRFEDDSVKVLKFFKPLYEPFVPKEQDFVGSVKTKLVKAGYLHPSAVSMSAGRTPRTRTSPPPLQPVRNKMIGTANIAHRFITISFDRILAAAAHFRSSRHVVKVAEAGPTVGGRRAFSPLEC